MRQKIRSQWTGIVIVLAEILAALRKPKAREKLRGKFAANVAEVCFQSLAPGLTRIIRIFRASDEVKG